MHRIYVESNFVLELLLEQDDATSCRELLGLASAGTVELVLSGLALMEAHFKVASGEMRERVTKFLADERKALSRSSETADLREAMLAVQTGLPSLKAVHQQRFDTEVENLQKLTRLIYPGSKAISAACEPSFRHDLSWKDAVHLETAIEDLELRPPMGEATFVSTDKAFADPDVKARLRGHKCIVVSSFRGAVAALKRLDVPGSGGPPT